MPERKSDAPTNDDRNAPASGRGFPEQTPDGSVPTSPEAVAKPAAIELSEISCESAEQEKAEQEKAEQEKAEQEKAEQEKAEQEKAEEERPWTLFRPAFIPTRH